MWRLFADPPANRFVEIAHKVSDANHVSAYYDPSYVTEALEEYKGKSDVYLGVALRTAQERTKEAAGEARAAWVDWDSKELPPAVLPPSFYIKTAHGFHLIWLLDTWVLPEEFEALNKVLIAHLGPGMAGADKCWYRNSRCRVPGTIHGGTGDEIKLVGAKGYIYKTGDIKALTNVDEKLSRKILTGDSRGYTSRSELDYAVITDLVRFGFSDNAINAIYDYQRIGDKFRQHQVPEHYLSTTLRKVRAHTDVLVESEGFSNHNGRLVIRTGKSMREVATFTLSPVRILAVDGDTDVLECDLSAGGMTVRHQFPRSAFNSLKAMVDSLPRMEWQWLGTDADVRNLLPWLYGQLASTDKVAATHIAGRHGKYVVLPSGLLSETDVYAKGEGPLVYVPGAVSAPSPKIAALSCDPRSVVAAALACNTPDVMVPALGWLFATALKTGLEAGGIRFPLLNVFGTQGCGKTTLVSRILLRLLEYQSVASYDATTTRFVLLSLLGCTNMFPIALAEFRAASARDYLLRYVRLMYDLGDDPRGKPDQTVSHYPLVAPVVIDGEDALDEPAALERVVGLRLVKSEIEPGSDLFGNFTKWQAMDVGGFATAWLKRTLSINSPVEMHQAALADVCKLSDRLPHRVASNFAVVWSGWLAIAEWLGKDLLPDIAALETAVSHSYNITTGRNKMQVDDLVEQIVLARSEGSTPFFNRYDDKKNELLFHFGGAMAWYEAQCKRRGMVTLGRDALAAQMEEAPYITGRRIEENRWCYIINLIEASRVLDVPSRLKLSQIVLEFGDDV